MHGICAYGVCEEICSDATQCVTGMSCQRGRCIKECDRDVDCGPSGECKTGQCHYSSCDVSSSVM